MYPLFHYSSFCFLSISEMKRYYLWTHLTFVGQSYVTHNTFSEPKTWINHSKLCNRVKILRCVPVERLLHTDSTWSTRGTVRAVGIVETNISLQYKQFVTDWRNKLTGHLNCVITVYFKCHFNPGPISFPPHFTFDVLGKTSWGNCYPCWTLLIQ